MSTNFFVVFMIILAIRVGSAAPTSISETFDGDSWTQLVMPVVVATLFVLSAVFICFLCPGCACCRRKKLESQQPSTVHAPLHAKLPPTNPFIDSHGYVRTGSKAIGKGFDDPRYKTMFGLMSIMERIEPVPRGLETNGGATYEISIDAWIRRMKDAKPIASHENSSASVEQQNRFAIKSYTGYLISIGAYDKEEARTEWMRLWNDDVGIVILIDEESEKQSIARQRQMYIPFRTGGISFGEHFEVETKWHMDMDGYSGNTMKVRNGKEVRFIGLIHIFEWCGKTKRLWPVFGIVSSAVQSQKSSGSSTTLLLQSSTGVSASFFALAFIGCECIIETGYVNPSSLLRHLQQSCPEALNRKTVGESLFKRQMLCVGEVWKRMFPGTMVKQDSTSDVAEQDTYKDVGQVDVDVDLPSDDTKRTKG